jgi:hypothetical protein
MRRFRPRAARRAVLSLGCALAVASARADLLTVCDAGCDWMTIQEAIDHATAGDTIRLQSLQPHTEANILVMTSVTIEGLPGLDTTVQAAASPGTFPGPVLAVAAGTSVLLRDLTLRYGGETGPGGGIHNVGSLTLDRVIVRDNIAQFNSLGDGGGVYNEGALVVRSSMFVGNGASSQGGGVYNTANATFTATDTLFFDETAGNEGGHVFNLGSAVLVRCRVAYGGAVNGAGIHSSGMLYFSGWIDSNTAATGAGIYQASGSLEVVDSVISGNSAPSGIGGGGAYLFGGSALFSNSTFSENSAANGGAIRQASSTALRIENSTLALNVADHHGGALFVGGTRRAKIRSSTIVENLCDGSTSGSGDGGGIYLEPCSGTCPTDRVFLANSIVAGNGDASPGGPFARDCYGLVTSEGYDLVQDASTGAVGTCRVDGDLTGVMVQTDPLLGDLTDNGGTPPIPDSGPPLLTYPELPGSPAIDAGDPAGCTDATGAPLARDQRDAARVGRCDLGAYEADGVPRLFADGFESGDLVFWTIP